MGNRITVAWWEHWGLTEDGEEEGFGTGRHLDSAGSPEEAAQRAREWAPIIGRQEGRGVIVCTLDPDGERLGPVLPVGESAAALTLVG